MTTSFSPVEPAIATAPVVGHIALNVLTNYFNVLTDVEDDWPVTVTPRTAA